MNIERRIEDHLHETLQRVLGFDFPAPALLGADWKGVAPDGVEKAASLYVNRDSREIMAWETRAARANRLQWLDHLADVASIACSDAQATNPEMIAGRFIINRLLPTVLPDTGDLILTKINHGFWEQLLLICNDGYDPLVTRPTARRGYSESYLDSRFLDALVILGRSQAKEYEGVLSFAGIDLGISFGSGDFWHGDLIARFAKLDAEMLRIIRGVHGGLSLFMSQMPEALRARFVDGAFAKKGLTDGSLASLLDSFSARVDHLAFVVPGHLAGIRLLRLAPERQQVLHVSGRIVHQAWPLMLAGVARPLLARLARGEHVGVIVQAAVFSALLPFYLVRAKADLGLPGQLSFLDLGQALDVLTPETGSTWIKKRSSDFGDDAGGLPLAIAS